MSITSDTHRLMAASVMMAPAAFIIMACAATALTPDYDSIGRTVSRLAEAGQPYGWLVHLSFVTYCLLVQPLGPLLHATVPTRAGGVILWLLVIQYGAGGALAAVFQVADDNLVMGGLSNDEMHHVAAAVSFTAIVALALLTPWFVRPVPAWRVWRRFSLLMAAFTLAFMVSFWLEFWPEIRGLLQRGFFVTTMAWVFVTALHLYRLMQRQGVAVPVHDWGFGLGRQQHW